MAPQVLEVDMVIRKRKGSSDSLEVPLAKRPSRSSRASTRTSTKSKVKQEQDDDDPDDSDESEYVDDDGNHTAASEEDAYDQFAGDNSDLESDPGTSKRKSSAKSSVTSGRWGKAKGVKAEVKKELEEVHLSDLDSDLEDEGMMRAALKASLKSLGGPESEDGTPKSELDLAAVKRARAAEKRLGIKSEVVSDSELSDEFVDSEPVKPVTKSKKKASTAKKAKIEGIDDIMTEKQKAKEAKKKQKAELAPLQKAQADMVRKLKRRLTWAEKNAVALSHYHPELIDVWGDLKDKIQPVVPTPMEAHPGFKLTLLPFQKESLFWMKKQEEGPWKGGMLADEMGMGKTIQTIALLLSEPRQKPSLVVAPVVALMQWKHEIETHAEGFTVCLWHGTGRIKAADLKKFDVVMVSYGTLEASFRKQQKGFKRGDMVIKEKSPMHSFQWHRVVLDEAHNIKERSTNAAKAAFALDAKYRWCLSGTPLQNRVGELYSLIRFLGGDPFAFYYCKRCPCKSLHWQFGNKRNCDDCGHSPMQHTCYWNNEILTPIQKYGMQGPGKDAFKKLKILLDRCMLRRTKIERADDLGLPPRTISIRRGYFSPEEKELYASLFSETRRQFSTYIAEGTILNNYSNVFSLITRMRQMACHPDLVLRSKTSKYVQTEEEVVCRLCHDTAEDAIVSKCNHLFDRECISQYIDGHEVGTVPVCPVCHIELTIDLGAEAVESGEEKKLKKQGILGRLDLQNWRSSTKLEMLVDELCELREKDCNIKSLVFSQFVSMLDLAAFRLQRAGFTICRLEGGMTPQARDATIQHFMKNPQVTVFLISLKAGGVALNLTEASQVFLLDSWWNPSVEYQSMDRIHRLGQHRPVQVTKLVVEDSIESKIIQLQDKKLAMTQAALATDPDSALGKLTEEDMQFLFRL